MKILVFTHRTNFSGGANRSLLNVLQGLKQNNNEIKVVLPKKKGELNDALSENKIDWEYCNYYRMGAKPFLKGPLKIFAYLILYSKLIHHFFASKKVLKKIKNEKYDVVYMNTILPYVGIFVSKKLNIPLVIHDREPLDGTDVPQIINYEKFLYDNSQKIIVISSDLQHQWEKRGLKEKITLINNGIVTPMLSKSDQSNKENFNILLTARITESKHQIDALRALKILKRDKNCNYKLYFAGSYGEKCDASYKEKLDKFIKENNLSEDVIFLGEVKNISEIRKDMNVELMLNPDEPFGRVTVEGMRSGLIVIGVNAGGTKDIIIDEVNGLFYEKDNIDDLVSKIKKVYNDEEYRKKLANSAYEYGNNHFTMEENVKKIENTLRETVEKGK